MSKFNRTFFYDEVEVDGVKEQDLLRNNFDLFEVQRPTTFFTMTAQYIQRPDLLSLKHYGNIGFWWILAKFNTIDDWWNDVEVGQVVRIPDPLDIDDFYIRVRTKRRGR